MLHAWLAGLALAAPPREVTVTYAASGLLLEALPQIAPGDRVRFLVVPDGDGSTFDGLSFTLRYGCGGRSDDLPSSVTLAGSREAVEAVLPEACTATPAEIRWDLLATPAGSVAAQRALHGAVEGYQTIDALAARALGGAPVSDGDRSRLDAAVVEVNRVVRGLDEAPPEVRAAFERVLAPVAFEGTLSAAPPREEWSALQTAARGAFDPYRSMDAELDRSARAARQRLRELDAEIEAAEIDERWYDANLEDVLVDDLPNLRDEALAVTQALAAARAEQARLEAQLGWIEDERRIVTLPQQWLATGSTRVGGRDRVLSIDPEHGRFEQTQLPIDDRDRVWVAVANTRADWVVRAVEREAIAGPEGGVAPSVDRGAASQPIPDLALRDPEPRYRTLLRDLGRRDGNQEITVTLTSSSEVEAVVQWRVRRTYHLAVKSGFVMSYQPNQELSFVTDEVGNLLYQDGVPAVASTGRDYQPGVLLGLAAYPYPTDLLDDTRREPWTRVVPHAFVGWSPTQFDRGYLGLGLEPVTGISVSVGATGGASQVLVRDPASYGWAIGSRFSVGWYAAVLTDVTLFRHLFQGF
jgi:hypothetical protein